MSTVKVPDLKNVRAFVLGTGLPLGNTIVISCCSEDPSSDSGADPFQAKAIENGKLS